MSGQADPMARALEAVAGFEAIRRGLEEISMSLGSEIRRGPAFCTDHVPRRDYGCPACKERWLFVQWVCSAEFADLLKMPPVQAQEVIVAALERGHHARREI